jgi:hypothetical protein
MDESAQVVVVPSTGTDRLPTGAVMHVSHDDELTTPSYYCVSMGTIEGGSILAAQSASA